jgi:hypothetical protein
MRHTVIDPPFGHFHVQLSSYLIPYKSINKICLKVYFEHKKSLDQKKIIYTEGLTRQARMHFTFSRHPFRTLDFEQPRNMVSSYFSASNGLWDPICPHRSLFRAKTTSLSQKCVWYQNPKVGRVKLQTPLCQIHLSHLFWGYFLPTLITLYSNDLVSCNKYFI